MKTLFRVTIAVILTLTLATCATAQAGNATTTGGSNTTTAAQLAAALDALNGGTRVSGNTVTLTRNVGVQGNLTVPAGVTLELTEDGGIYLMRDNITLTVNGILNVPSTRIGQHQHG
ncbi:MAG: hypothetical protein LBQ94_00410 [Treponema sp.]|jgi:hypothetical protein|nr:hypothetical protein [Treponema sp.]